MARPNQTLPRAIGAGVAIAALALAACSKSTPTPGPTPTPTPFSSGGVTPTPAANTVGIAYLPDGGNGGILHGIQVVHFEAPDGNLLGVPQPMTVFFGGSVGPFGETADTSDALAVISTTGGAPFTQAQDIFGSSTGSLVPAGATYDITLAPTPAPSATPTPSSNPPPVVPDAASVVLLGTGSAGVALVAGGGAVGFLGLTSLTNAPPQFGGFVPFQGGAISPPLYPRPNIAVSADNTDALVRGPLDLMALTITLVSTGYQFNITGYDGSLGYGSAVLRGHGAIAFDPSNAGRAILGQSPTANNIILITGLPKTITQTSTLLLSSTPRSIAITPNGSYAIVGADAGFYVVGGVDAGALMLQTPFAPSATSGSANSPAYVACDGSMRNLQNITSVAVTSNGKYIVLLGSAPGLSCLNGYNDTVVVLPFNQSNGSTPTPAPTPAPTTPPQGGATPAPTPTPVPTMFTQNNIVTQPANTDYMVVR